MTDVFFSPSHRLMLSQCKFHPVTWRSCQLWPGTSLGPPTQLVLVAGLLVDNSMNCFYLEYSFNTIHPTTGAKKLRVLFEAHNLICEFRELTHRRTQRWSQPQFQASNVDNGDAVTVTPGEVLGDFPVSPACPKSRLRAGKIVGFSGWSSFCQPLFMAGKFSDSTRNGQKMTWRLVLPIMR